MQAVDNNLRWGVQLRGSSGSSEGVGTRTMSRCPPSAWRACMVPSRSTRWTVPGMKSRSGGGVGLVLVVSGPIVAMVLKDAPVALLGPDESQNALKVESILVASSLERNRVTTRGAQDGRQGMTTNTGMGLTH